MSEDLHRTQEWEVLPELMSVSFSDFLCQLCQKGFSSSSSYRRHLRDLHGDSNQQVIYYFPLSLETLFFYFDKLNPTAILLCSKFSTTNYNSIKLVSLDYQHNYDTFFISSLTASFVGNYSVREVPWLIINPSYIVIWEHWPPLHTSDQLYVLIFMFSIQFCGLFMS